MSRGLGRVHARVRRTSVSTSWCPCGRVGGSLHDGDARASCEGGQHCRESPGGESVATADQARACGEGTASGEQVGSAGSESRADAISRRGTASTSILNGGRFAMTRPKRVTQYSQIPGEVTVLKVDA